MCLPAPFGWDSPNAAHISLLGVPYNESVLESALLAFSCWPPAIAKIKAVLRYSQRYDCLVQGGWFRSQQREVTERLAAAGIKLRVNYWTTLQ
jgi:hypothetical protein